MTVVLAQSRERSSKDGMSYGSLVDYESQRIKNIVLSTTVGGLWMDISGEVANLHTRIDAKNLVTTA